MSMKSGIAQSPYGSIKQSSPIVPSLDDVISGYRSPGMRSAKASVSMPGSPLSAAIMSPLKSVSDNPQPPPAMSLQSDSKEKDNEGRRKGSKMSEGGDGNDVSEDDDEGFTRTLSEVGKLDRMSPPDSPMMRRRSSKEGVWGEPTLTPLTKGAKEKISSDIIDVEPLGITTIRNYLEDLPGHLTDMVQRIVSDPGFKEISAEVRLFIWRYSVLQSCNFKKRRIGPLIG